MDNVSLKLAENPSIKDFHQYVRELKEVRGFVNDPMKSFILINKEIGDFAQLMRKTWGDKRNIHEEHLDLMKRKMGDIFIFLVDLSNQYDLNLQDAFLYAESFNKEREWPEYYHD